MIILFLCCLENAEENKYVNLFEDTNRCDAEGQFLYKFYIHPQLFKTFNDASKLPHFLPDFGNIL
jgi:hypothetical protein